MPNAAQAGAVIFAKDLHHVARIYEERLGLPAVHGASDHLVLASEQCELVIHAIPKAIADSIDINLLPQRRTETPIKLHFSLPASPRHTPRPPSSVVSSTRHKVSGQRAASAPATRGNTGARRLYARLGLREFSQAVVRVDSKRRVGRAVCAIVSHRS